MRIKAMFAIAFVGCALPQTIWSIEDTDMYLYSHPVILQKLKGPDELSFFERDRYHLSYSLYDHINPFWANVNKYSPDGTDQISKGLVIDSFKDSLRDTIVASPYLDEVLSHFEIRGFFQKLIKGSIGNTEEMSVGVQNVYSPSRVTWFNTLRDHGYEYGLRLGNSQAVYYGKVFRDTEGYEVAAVHLRYHLYTFPGGILRPGAFALDSHKIELISEVPLTHHTYLTGGLIYSTRTDDIAMGKKYEGSLRIERRLPHGAGSLFAGTDVFDRPVIYSGFWKRF